MTNQTSINNTATPANTPVAPTSPPPVNPTSTFWDPAGQAITTDSFSTERQKIEEKFTFFESHPGAPRRNLLLWAIPVPLAVIYFALNPTTFQNIISSYPYLLIAPFIPAAIYWHRIRSLQQDLIKMLISKHNGWLYSPEENRQRWSMFSARFSELFQKGTQDQNMQDEFWGSVSLERQTMPFYSGIFKYTVVTGSGKRRRRKTYTKNIIAVKLNKMLATDFRLEPEGFLMKIFNIFRKHKEIETESEEFNKTFAVFYKGTKVEKELGIIKALTPAVQTSLLELKKNEGPFALMFRGDAAIFMFDGQLLKKTHTDFFKGVKLDPRDEEYLAKKLGATLGIAGAIVPYLD